jgi:hypothetical protein
MRSLRCRSLASVFSMTAFAMALSLTHQATAAASIELDDFAVADVTAEQRVEVEALRRALVEKGIPTDGIGVFELPTSDGLTTIVTRTPDEFIVGVLSGSLYEITRLESAAASPPIGQPLGIRPLSTHGPRWVRNNADCDIYSTEGFRRTQCFEIVQQAQDKDGKQSFWQYTAQASGQSKGSREMNRMWVERKPAPGSARQHFDGIPEPKEARNRADNCVQHTEGISIQSGAPVQVGLKHDWTRMTCETYRPQMYEDEGHWATVWEGNPEVGSDDMRHVMFTMPVRTAEGAVPTWVRLNGQRTTR